MKLSYSDKAHAYYLNGARCRSWSAAGKVLEDGYALDAWRKRMVAIGIATRPALVDEIAAHYDDRDKLDEICEQALELANASHGARRGTAIHSITERSDAGVESMIQTDLVVAVEAKWKQLLTDHGIEVIPELMERICVWPDERIAGRFDRIVRWDGRLVVLDVKSSDSSIRYPHSTSVQLAGYAYAPLLAGALDKKGVTTTFEPMPAEVDKNVALVAHVPDEGPASLHVVDIAAGHAAIRDLILPIYRWRSLTTLVKPAPAPLTLVSEEAVDPDGPARRDEIAARLGALTQDEKATAAASWPAHILTPKKATRYSAAEHLEVSKLLDSLFGFPVVEVVDQMPGFVTQASVSDGQRLSPPQSPFGAEEEQTVPGGQAGVRSLDGASGAASGDTAPDTYFASRTVRDAVIDILKSLPSEQFSVVEVACKAAGVPNLRSGAPTLEHIHLVLSEVVRAATEEWDDDLRAVLVGNEPLTVSYVTQLLSELPHMVVTFTKDGTPSISYQPPEKVNS